MKIKDVKFSKVTRNRFDEMVVTFKTKREDYTNEDYESLHALEIAGVTKDLDICDSEATVNPATGEITQENGSNY